MNDTAAANTPIKGVSKIADFLKESPRRTYHLLETRQLPAYKLGGRWHLRPETYEAHLAKLEARAIGSG